MVLLAGTRTVAAEEGGEITGEAAEHYKRGRQLYADQRYDEAATELRRALEFIQHPILMYNVALAEWRAGRYERALEMSRRAARKDLPAPVDAKNRGLEQGLAVRSTTAALSRRTTPREQPDPAGRDETRGGGFGSKGWIGLGLASTGVLSIAGAVWVDHRIGTKAELYRDAARNNDYRKYDRLNRELRRQQRLGVGLLAGGVVASGVGTYLLVSDLVASRGARSRVPRRADPALRVTWAPSWHPSLLGAHLRLHW